MDTSELTGDLLNDLDRWRLRLYAIESLAQYPRTRSDAVFALEIGERAWRGCEYPS